MDDLKIVKRILEIEEGREVNCYIHEHDGICFDSMMCGMVFREAYNPLTDDGKCFRLMLKYKVDWQNRESFKSGAAVKGDILIADNNPNRAICLAIIEANNETTN